jgi:hypothetical protein
MFDISAEPPARIVAFFRVESEMNRKCVRGRGCFTSNPPSVSVAWLLTEGTTVATNESLTHNTEIRMNKILSFTVALAFILFLSENAMSQSSSRATGKSGVQQYGPFDEDGDGIPNGQDVDFKKPQDGTGKKFGKNGMSDDKQKGNGNGMGSGKGKGYKGTGLRDGSGNGSGLGTGICDGSGPKGKGRRR